MNPERNTQKKEKLRRRGGRGVVVSLCADTILPFALEIRFKVNAISSCITYARERLTADEKSEWLRATGV